MDAHAVQTDLSGSQDLIAHELVAREGIKTFGVIGLIKGQLQIHGPVVKGHITEIGSRQGKHGDLAHAEIGMHLVGGSAVAQRSGHFIEERIIERPKPRIRHIDGEGEAFLSGRYPLFDGNGGGAAADLQAKPQAFRRSLAEPGLHPYLLLVDIGRNVQCFEKGFSAHLQVGRLPDAARRAVALLALQLERMRRVVNANRQPLGSARLQVLR